MEGGSLSNLFLLGYAGMSQGKQSAEDDKTQALADRVRVAAAAPAASHTLIDEQLRQEWNDRNPSWAYRDRRSFWRALCKAVEDVYGVQLPT
jgi:hypothetical protein